MPEKNFTAAKIAKPMDYLIILTAITMWSASFVGMKVALEQAHPMIVLCMRLMISIPFLFAGTCLQRTFRFPSKDELPPLLVMSFQGIFFVLALQNFAMRTASASAANWIIICTPAFVALLGWVFLREKITRRGLGGLLISAAGVMTVLRLGVIRAPAIAEAPGTMGDFLILLSSLNWAIFLVFSKKVLKDDLPYSFVLFWEMFFAFVYAAIAVLIFRCDLSSLASFSVRTWSALAFLGAGASAGAYFCWFHGLSVLPVSRIIAFQFLQPFTGAVIAYLLLGERFTAWLFLGGITIIYGVYLVNKR